MRLYIVLILCSLVAPAVQLCCGRVNEIGGTYCHPKRPCGSIFFCCNIWCCNCDGDVCADGRGEDWLRSSLESFNMIDADKNGLISEAEGMTFLNATSTSKGPGFRGTAKEAKGQGDWFVRMDKNGDGVIQPAEFDSSLA